MERPERPDPNSEAAKNEARAEIATLKRLVENATVEVVDEPTGRKDVEIAWTDSDGFHVEEGTALGVYYDGERASPERVHVDWEDGSRTTVEQEDIETLEEGEYYT